MKNGYNIYWTENAIQELENTVEYLSISFPVYEINKLSIKLESILELISINPKLFPIIEEKQIRKVTVLKYNSIYSKVIEDRVEILSFFSNRQDTYERKL